MASSENSPDFSNRRLSTSAIAGILTAVGLTIFFLITLMLILLYRAITKHKRLIADLETRGVAVRPQTTPEMTSGHIQGPPKAVLRKNYLPSYLGFRDWPSESSRDNSEKSALEETYRNLTRLTRKSSHRAHRGASSHKARAPSMFERPRNAPNPQNATTTKCTSNKDTQQPSRGYRHVAECLIPDPDHIGPVSESNGDDKVGSLTMQTTNPHSTKRLQNCGSIDSIVTPRNDSAVASVVSPRGTRSPKQTSRKRADTACSGDLRDQHVTDGKEAQKGHMRSLSLSGSEASFGPRSIVISRTPLNISEVLEGTSPQPSPKPKLSIHSDGTASSESLVSRSKDCSPIQHGAEHNVGAAVTERGQLQPTRRDRTTEQASNDANRPSMISVHSSAAKIERVSTPMAFYNDPKEPDSEPERRIEIETVDENCPAPALKPKSSKRLRLRVFNNSPSKTKKKNGARIVLGELTNKQSTTDRHAARQSSDSRSTRSSNGNPFQWDSSPVKLHSSSSFRPRSKSPLRTQSKSDRPLRGPSLKKTNPKRPQDSRTHTQLSYKSPTGNAFALQTITPKSTSKKGQTSCISLRLKSDSIASDAPTRSETPTTLQPDSIDDRAPRTSSTSNTLPFRSPLLKSNTANGPESTPSKSHPTSPRRSRSFTADASSIISHSLFELPKVSTDIERDSDDDPASANSAFGPQSLTSPTFLSLFCPFPADSLLSPPVTFPLPTTNADSDIEFDVSTPILQPFTSSLRSASNPPSIRPDSATIDPSILARPPSFPPLSRASTLRSTMGSFRRRQRAATFGSTSTISSRARPRSTNRHTPASSRDLTDARRGRPDAQPEIEPIPALPNLVDFRAWLESDSTQTSGESAESANESGPSTPPRTTGGVTEVQEDAQFSPKSLYDDDGFLRF